ncbi:MAG: DUF5123 domain-containing protein [Flavobacterium sp.]
MKTKYISNGLIASLLLTFAVSGCESYNEGVKDTLEVNREFSPIGLTTKIRNQTTVELNWTVKDDEAAGHYVVEFSADDPDFKTIFKTIEVSPSQLPVLVPLEGETVYSIRVKAVSGVGLGDSKWSVTTATTLNEQLFLPVQDTDIEAKEVILKWTPNSAVTQISLTPDGIIHTITPAEKTAGIATVTGLTGETNYTAVLLNGAKKRGVAVFKTGIDIGTGILVRPEDNDLSTKINEAASGAVLVLMPGDYTSQIATFTLDKSITIRGLKSGDKPRLKAGFSLSAGSGDVSLIDLDLTGDTASSKTDVVKYAESGTFGKLLISGCLVHDYDRSFVTSGSGIAAKIESVTIENSIVTTIGGPAATGEFLDFRSAFVANIVLLKSTFNNCAPARAFIREDATAGFGTGLTSNILIDSCTLYGVTNTVATNGYQILYVRFVTNATIIRNSIFAATVARFANQAATVAPTFTNNNYYNAATLNSAAPVSPLKSDVSGSALDPQFVNAAAGDFTIKNQTLIDRNVGDPRWIK